MDVDCMYNSFREARVVEKTGCNSGETGCNGNDSYCEAFWDTFSCWPATKAGSWATLSCPRDLQGVDPEKNATKFCYRNATWALADYNDCLMSLGHSTERHLDSEDVQINEVARIIYNIGYVISSATLIAALFIFLYFRTLRCLKNFIHSHLIVTFILRNVVWMIMDHTLTTIVDDNHTWACRFLVFIFNYAQVTNFFWMLVEGLYLHIIVVWTYTADRIRKWYFVCIGWGIPVMIVVPWVIVRLNIQTHRIDVEEDYILLRCWLPTVDIVPHIEKLDLIYIVPILMVLAINILFLGSIIWILITKMRATNSWETQQLRKAIKATLLLFPLLGITYVVFLTTPNNGKGARHAHKIVNAFLQSFQGFFVSLFYCFLNEEVKSVIRRKFSSCRDTSKSQRLSRSSVGWTNDSVIRKESVIVVNGKLTPIKIGKIKPKFTTEVNNVTAKDVLEVENML